MEKNFITKYNSVDELSIPKVISVSKFLSEIRNENEVVNILRYLSEKYRNISLKNAQKIISECDTISFRDRKPIENARNIDEMIDALKLNLNYYCLSGYYDQELERFFHSGLFVLDFRTREQSFLINKLNDDPYVLTHFPSCTGNSVKAIILGKSEPVDMDMEEVTEFHDYNFKEISKYYHQSTNIKPNQDYSIYSKGVLQTYLEELEVNNPDEFFN